MTVYILVKVDYTYNSIKSNVYHSLTIAQKEMLSAVKDENGIN